jgi:S1-C subfamily serine protease
MEQDTAGGSVAELLQLGRMGLELGYRQQAEAYYDQALELSPRHPEALKGKARVTRDAREALALVRVVLQDRPGDREATALESRLLREIDERARALESLPVFSAAGRATGHSASERRAPRPLRGWLFGLAAIGVLGLAAFVVAIAFGGSLIGAGEELVASEPVVEAAPLADDVPVDGAASSGLAVALRKAEFAIALIIVPVPNSTRAATGSGSVITSDGLVLTNYHVVADDAMTALANPDGLAFVGLTQDAREKPDEWYIAAVVASDPERDLAVLRILHTADGQTARSRRFQPIAIADSSGLALGQPIVALGYPTLGGATITLTRGSMAGFVTEDEVRYGKTDSELLPGSSGGAVLDEQGRMVGIITGAMTEARTQGRLSYFVLSSEARDVIGEARNARAPRLDVQWMIDAFAKLEL